MLEIVKHLSFGNFCDLLESIFVLFSFGLLCFLILGITVVDVHFLIIDPSYFILSLRTRLIGMRKCKSWILDTRSPA